MGVAAIVLVMALRWHQRQFPPDVPRPDLTQATPGVRRTIEHFADEVRRNPRSATAWGQLGSVLYAYRLYPAALEALAQAERRDPRNPRWPYLQAIIRGIDHPEAALPLLRRTVDLCGNDPPAPRLRLARWFAEQGHWTEAQAELDPLLSLRPEPPHALLLAAQAAQNRGNLPEAIQWARRAAESPWTARPALGLLAFLLARSGDAEGARDAAARSTDAPGSELLVDPFDAEALALRSDPQSLTERVHPLLARGRLDAAAAIVSEMTREHPEYADSWLAAGRLAYLQKDFPLAEQHLRRHLQLEPRSVQGWFQLGMTHLARRQDAEAATDFQRATELKPDLSPAWHNRGLALGRLGHRVEAMAAFRESLRYSPEHLDTYLLFADLHLQSGQPAEALALLDQAAQLSPNDPRIAGLRRKAGRPPLRP